MATIQTTGLLSEMPKGEGLNAEDVTRKAEGNRQPENGCIIEKVGDVRWLACMNLAAAGSQALEGCHGIALDACTQVERELQALTHSARALWFALMKGEEEDPVKVRALCERIVKSAALACPEVPRPPREADSVDVLCYALCFMAWVQSTHCTGTNAEKEDWKKARWEDVRLVLGTKHQQSAPGKTYPWIMEALEGLVGIYDRAGAYSSAAEVCVLHSRLVDLPTQLRNQSIAAVYWQKAGDMGRAVEIIEAAVAASQQLEESDWELRARIHISAASVWQEDGQVDRAVAAREEAWRLCSTRTNLDELTYPEDFVKGMLCLLSNYHARRSWSSAYKLVHFMDAYMDEHLEAWNQHWERWNFMKANIARAIGDLEQAKTVLRHMHEVLTGNDRVQSAQHDLPRHELMLLTLTPELLASNGNWKLAMTKAERALKALQRVSPPMKSDEMYMRILLCFGLEALGRHQELDAKLEAAVSEDESQVSDEQLMILRLLQAKAALRLGDTAAAWAHTQVAETLAAKDSVNLVAVKYHQAYVMRGQQQWMSAAKLAGEAAVLAAAQQREDCYQDNEPTSWVLFFDHHMNSVYWLLQELWIKHLRRPERGLLWAERANVRHLLHQIHKEGEVEQLFDPVELEHCDTLLESIIWATVKSLSPTTAIIHYVYNTFYGKLFMYVSRHSAESTSGVAVFCTICQLSTWFRDAGEPPTTLLEEVVRKARTDIMNNEDSKGPIKALATLHALLVQFIEADLEGCDTLIFAPGHGCLSLVPFAALYDGRKGKFLVQVQATKGVAVIPSITTLYRCLQQQDKFQARMQFPYPDEVPFLESVFGQGLHRKGGMMQDSWQPSKVAFIGGNPEPMGLGWPPLDFALHEAIAVASYFNVQPCLGRNMTKKAVLEGLADSGVVLLATHGMVDEARYPHGCLVMQGPAGCSTTRETDAHGATEKGHRSSHVFQGTDASSRLRKEQEAGQVLTASEIANLEGGIAAGLVVLSACESGQGEVTGSEGLLGLGRALLQAGAPTAVLTLWKVRDGHQMWMVAGLFHVLYVDSRTRGTTVCQALQIIMEGWIRQGIPIYSWASLSIVGSPLLHLGCSACEDGLSLAKTLYDREIWPHCAQTSCMVCDRHRKRLLSLTECQTLVERTAKNC